jgi:uncharacterized DUF497 family protein
MLIEWDEAKNRANIRKHGFDFADATTRERQEFEKAIKD